MPAHAVHSTDNRYALNKRCAFRPKRNGGIAEHDEMYAPLRPPGGNLNIKPKVNLTAARVSGTSARISYVQDDGVGCP